MSFSFSAVSNETPPGELKGYSMDVVTSWDSSTYDPIRLRSRPSTAKSTAPNWRSISPYRKTPTSEP